MCEPDSVTGARAAAAASDQKNSSRNEQPERVHSEGNIKKSLLLKERIRVGGSSKMERYEADTKFHFLVGQSCKCGTRTPYIFLLGDGARTAHIFGTPHIYTNILNLKLASKFEKTLRDTKFIRH